MCGIFAYNGKKTASSLLLHGLEKLEYRGYDSAGLAAVDKDGNIFLKKALGKVSNLSTLVQKSQENPENFHTGIAHTRWATHGGVKLDNCHPHYDQGMRFFLVHNGIIENFSEIKNELSQNSYNFYGETDSETVAKLLENIAKESPEKNLKELVETACTKISGAYALVVIDTENPEELVGAKVGSPMVLGTSEDEIFLASDVNALKGITKQYIHLDDGEIVAIKNQNYSIYSSGKIIEKIQENIEGTNEDISKGDFEHFMLKEIFETPEVLKNSLRGRVDFENYEIHSSTLEKLGEKNIENIEIIASGTSYNAGFTASYFFEEYAGIPCQVHISSEYKYKKRHLIKDTTLYIFISQSGETADVLECLKLIKNKGGLTFGVVNVVGSSIARLTDLGMYTHSGVEIGVASTKAFIGQLGVLLIMALYLGNKTVLEYEKFKNILDELQQLDQKLSEVLKQKSVIQDIAKKYANFSNTFFIGRNIFYPIAMEASLKCKEITYNHTECYSAGELKHGPLSLIDENFPSILINPNSTLEKKNISTLQEIQARNGTVIGVISAGNKNKSMYNDSIEVPETSENMSIFTVSIALQLFAYYQALFLGKEIDKPRNLAKSVTVE